jgi:hypothetical protein
MIQPKSNIKWKELVTGQKTYQFQFLATKILMSRLILSTKSNPSPENISKCIDDAYNFFVKNEKFAQSDLNQIFG